MRYNPLPSGKIILRPARGRRVKERVTRDWVPKLVLLGAATTHHPRRETLPSLATLGEARKREMCPRRIRTYIHVYVQNILTLTLTMSLEMLLFNYSELNSIFGCFILALGNVF